MLVGERRRQSARDGPSLPTHLRHPQKSHAGADQKPGFFLRTCLLKQRYTHRRRLASTGNDKKHATLLREVCYCVVLHCMSVRLLATHG